MKNFVVPIAFVFSLSLAANASDNKQAAPAVPDIPAKPVVLPMDKMQSGKYKLDPVHYSVVVKVGHFGEISYPIYRFTRVDATLDLDSKNPEKSKVVVKLDPKSISSDYKLNRDYTSAEAYKNRDWEDELRTKPFWLNADKFPEITFTSTQIKKTGKDTGVLYGKLTLLGVTKEIQLKVKFNGGVATQPTYKQPVLGFSAKGEIKRSDFGMKAFLNAVSDKVEIMIEAEFIKEGN